METFWERSKAFLLALMELILSLCKKGLIKLGKWAKANPRQAAVVVLVLGAHISLLVYAHSTLIIALPDRPIHKTRVHTVRIQKPKPVAKPRPVPRKAPPKPVAKKTPPPKPVEKKPAPPKPVAKKPAPQPKPEKQVVRSAIPDKRRQELLKQIEESIEKIDKSSHKYSSDPVPEVPKTLGPLSIDKEPEPQVSAYQDELVSRLQLMLRLPDYGDVRVRLTLGRDGSVKRVEIVSSESLTNSAYVKDTLPSLRFAAFGSQYKGEKEHIFLLTLTNDM